MASLLMALLARAEKPLSAIEQAMFDCGHAVEEYAECVEPSKVWDSKASGFVTRPCVHRGQDYQTGRSEDYAHLYAKGISFLGYGCFGVAFLHGETGRVIKCCPRRDDGCRLWLQVCYLLGKAGNPLGLPIPKVYSYKTVGKTMVFDVERVYTLASLKVKFVYDEWEWLIHTMVTLFDPTLWPDVHGDNVGFTHDTGDVVIIDPLPSIRKRIDYRRIKHIVRQLCTSSTFHSRQRGVAA